MINVSNEFKQRMNAYTDFKQYADITFADGRVENLTKKDFSVSNNSVTDASETNGIPLGVAVCRYIQIEIRNDDERYSDYDFYGARIHLYLTFQLSETEERIEYGTFTVLTPETYGETVIITAVDDMYKADSSYTTSLPFPATIGAMLRDACTTLGISQGTTTFLNDDFVVEAAPADITFRQLFGYIAMIAGGNARIDVTSRLRIISYDFGLLDEISKNINGGAFSPWKHPTNLDGGDFTYTSGDIADGGNFTDELRYHILYNWSNLKLDTDDVVITGISTTCDSEEDEEETVIYGTEGYLLQIENPLIAGKEAEAVALIGNIMVGGRFRQFDGDLVSNPTCEFMDAAAVIDRKNNVYVSFLTDINFQFFGYTNLKNSAQTVLRNSSKGYSDATKTLVAARKLIKKERTARERAVEQLAKDLSESSGLFMTQEVQADKSIIYYMHDKATLQESMIVWKLTALAFGISTDGGKTYPYGFSVDGTTITRLLYAEGIDADYIDTGAIRIVDTDGETVFFADYNTRQVYMNGDKILIESGNDETTMNAAFKVFEEGIQAKVGKDEIIAQINLTEETVQIDAAKINLNGVVTANNYFKILKDGSVDIIGGTIAGYQISAGKLESLVNTTEGQVHAGIGAYGENYAFFAGIPSSVFPFTYYVTHDGYIFGKSIDCRNYIAGNEVAARIYSSSGSNNVYGFRAGVSKEEDGAQYYGWGIWCYGNEMQGDIYAYADGFKVRSQADIGIECGGDGIIHLEGNVVYHGDFAPLSARKYKKNFQEITEEDADKILELTPMEYDYIATGKHSCGFIADDVYGILPKVVGLKNGEPDNMDSIKLIPFMVKELQILSKKLELLEKERSKQDG